MDFQQVLYARRAVRAFTAEPVDEAVLRQLIDAAVQAPSAVNEQPWLFSVVRDRAVLARISAAAKAHVLAHPPAGLARAFLHEVVENPDFDIFYNAPALVVISSATAGHWAVEDCTLAAENLMLAACAAGLGTCWIGFAQAWLGTEEGKSIIRVPRDAIPVAPIIVGRPEFPPPAVPRKSPEIAWIG